MPAARIVKLELQGFRSFGHARQVIEVPETVSVIWGGNSQGKTSFAEAIEFLLTGQIVRRDLMASAKDEFTEALRNVHLAPPHAVFVQAHILCPDGVVRILTRTLVEDYKRGASAGCVSRLAVNGTTCRESDIEALLGIRLSQPPLRAPVLAQHTLAYIFSATPTERATYFRALLDTQDLEDFRLAAASLSNLLKLPVLPQLEDLEKLQAVDAFQNSASALPRCSSEPALMTAISGMLMTVLTGAGLQPGSTMSDQLTQVGEELQRRRVLAFPLAMFSRSVLPAGKDVLTRSLDPVARFISERDKVDVETQKLVDLFTAALALPHQPVEHHSIDCPLCGAKDTFTAARLAYIRQQLRSKETFAQATRAYRSALQSMSSDLIALGEGVSKAQPTFMRERSVNRRSVGFTVLAMTKMGIEPEILRFWLDGVRPLWRSMAAFQRALAAAVLSVGKSLDEDSHLKGTDQLQSLFSAVESCYVQVDRLLQAYQGPARELGEALKLVADQSADTKGWDLLTRIAADAHGLWHAMTVMTQHDRKLKSLTKALQEIDGAKGRVEDSKFVDLSDGVRYWWDMLRPGEPTYFENVGRRSVRSRRNIDLRVGLSANADGSDRKIRDAVAVFSQSQLHCLGLSLFLARAIQEGAGFVLLDDPVLTSDDDYRPNFVSLVIEGLIERGVQVLICTQDHGSWKDIGARWQHRGAMQFTLIRHDPLSGTEIRSQDDDLEAMLARAQPLINSPDLRVRKDGATRIREAIERFCKLLLVKDRISKGDTAASIVDYDGKNFGNYGASVMGLLIKDPSHPGKLRTAHRWVSPGAHDDKPPSSGELRGALGDLRRMKRDYLDP